jgi:hypothetical protein
VIVCVCVGECASRCLDRESCSCTRINLDEIHHLFPSVRGLFEKGGNAAKKCGWVKTW